MFSVGVLYSATRFLALLEKAPCTSDEFLNMSNTFYVASTPIVLETSLSGGWVRINSQKKMHPTSAGVTILEARTSPAALRLQLRDLIIAVDPPWTRLLTKGRMECIPGLSDDVGQIFVEAELLDGYEDEIVEWWVNLDKHLRLKRADYNVEVGRQGERLSIMYEQDRTGTEPVWQGLESNLSGFDVLSVRDKNNLYPLRIEVKASLEDLDEAHFHLTRSEWDVATSGLGGYVLHLWLLNYQPPRLFIVEHDEVQPHISVDRGKGKWESVLIPYLPFSKREVSHNIIKV
ncbi:MAG: DUF3883 domain-containing protein [Planctomycetes bacterium]|nr:DUF3883 domain-containing protein [Planctomycetota bacterium]